MQNCIIMLKESAEVQNQTIDSLETQVKTLKGLRKTYDYEEKREGLLSEQFLSLEKEKIRAEEDSDFYQHKYESLAKELRETKEKLEEAESIKLKYTALKTDFEEFSEKLQKKDEVIRNSNNRYTLIVKKIDALTTEKKI